MENYRRDLPTKGKIMSVFCLIVFILSFIFSCMPKKIVIGAKIVGTFGMLTYPLLILLSLVCLGKFLGMVYTRSKKATFLMLAFLFSVTEVVHLLSLYSELAKIVSVETIKTFIKYSYNNLTVAGSFGCIVGGFPAIIIGSVGTIIFYVILATILLGLFIDYEIYGKADDFRKKQQKMEYRKKEIADSTNFSKNNDDIDDLRKVNSNTYFSEDGLTNGVYGNSAEKRGFFDRLKKKDKNGHFSSQKDIVAEITEDVQSSQCISKDVHQPKHYLDSDIASEITDDKIYSDNSDYESQNYFGNNSIWQNNNSQPSVNSYPKPSASFNFNSKNNFSTPSYDFGRDAVTENKFSNDVYKEPDYPDIYDENENRRKFMQATFDSSYSDTSLSSDYNNLTSAYYEKSQTKSSDSTDIDNHISNIDLGLVQELNFGSDALSSATGNSDNYSKTDNSNKLSFIDEELKSYPSDNNFDYNSSIYKNFNDSDPYSIGGGRITGSEPENDRTHLSVDDKISAILESDTMQSRDDSISHFDKEDNVNQFVVDDYSQNSSNSENNDVLETPESDNFNSDFYFKKTFDVSDNENEDVKNTDIDDDLSNNAENDLQKIKIPSKEISKKSEVKKSHKFVLYNPPTSDILNPIVKDNGVYDEEQNRKARGLEKALESFNIPVTVANIIRGPKITRYCLSLPLGVSVKKIPNHELDIKRLLAAKSIHIEAPITGSEFVGIELENDTFTDVCMREMVESKEFREAKDPLPIIIGKDISGEIVVRSLVKMLHLLIAGQTGSGKSVFIHSLIMSLIYKYSPEDLKLVIIDPKKVEFNRYNGIPHLITPTVVSGTEKAINALKWCVSEMERRYELMSKSSFSQITNYNNSELVKTGQLPKFPYIVIIVDEFAEVIMANKKEAESCIQRLTQLARACGMHLVLATQRPSVDIMSGVIKNNVPSRVALSLASAFDSKTILGTVGAENLLGHGDMIFAPGGTSVMMRLQAPNCTDEEIMKVVDYVKKNNEADFDEQVANAIDNTQKTTSDYMDGMADNSADSEIIKVALKLFIERGVASGSYLQRRLSIGYSKAARIMDILENKGYIAQSAGSKTRKVLITPEQFKNEFNEEVVVDSDVGEVE